MNKFLVHTFSIICPVYLIFSSFGPKQVFLSFRPMKRFIFFYNYSNWENFEKKLGKTTLRWLDVTNKLFDTKIKPRVKYALRYKVLIHIFWNIKAFSNSLFRLNYKIARKIVRLFNKILLLNHSGIMQRKNIEYLVGIKYESDNQKI